MTVGAIGAIQGFGYGSLAGLRGAGPVGAAAPGQPAELLRSSTLGRQLIDAVNASNLPPGTKVAISDAAQGLLSADSSQNNAGFGDLAQSLIVALILLMLTQ